MASVTGAALISVKGRFKKREHEQDIASFAAIASGQLHGAVVFLEGTGGSALTAIRIDKLLINADFDWCSQRPDLCLILRAGLAGWQAAVYGPPCQDRLSRRKIYGKPRRHLSRWVSGPHSLPRRPTGGVAEGD
jgi:hypothetical protein